MVNSKTMRQFALSTLATAAIVACVGWFTDAQAAMHGGLIVVASVAFLPFIIILSLIVISIMTACGLAALGALTGADGGVEVAGGGLELAAGGAELVPWYYAVLGRQRHPVFWGALSGLLLGSGILAALSSIFILPGETKTAEILTRTQTDLIRIYREQGEFPSPDPNGHLLAADLAPELNPAPDGVVLDGFGRPILYEVEPSRREIAYRLRSHGYDGRSGGDDYCIAGTEAIGGASVFDKIVSAKDALTSGESKLDRFVKTTDALISLAKALKENRDVSMETKFQAVRDLRCE